MENQGVSILISTYNGATRLSRTLESLSELDTSTIPFVELIIVDNASTDGTLEFSENKWIALGTPFPLKSITENRPGKLHAQEAGLKIASGEYILICDDDNSFYSDYLQIGIKYLNENPKIGVLGGRGIGMSTIEFPEWFEQKSYLYGCAPQAPKTGNVRPTRNVVYGAGMWFRHSAYLKSKSLDYEFILGSRIGSKLITGAEDSEVCWMLIFLGYEVWYIDEMQFHHHITENRLTENYLKKLILGMTESGLTSSIHNRIWNGVISQKVKWFWIKELVYSIREYIKIGFSSLSTNKKLDLKRVKNNILILLKERSKYDEKVNRILDYKEKCNDFRHKI